MVDEWLQPQWNTDDAQGLENENARSNGNDKFNRPFANMGYLVNNVARRVSRNIFDKTFSTFLSEMWFFFREQYVLR